MKTPESVLLRPIVTEKSARLAQFNQYVFAVALDATKIDVAQAVTKLFKVKVQSVRTVTAKGKVKRRGRTRLREVRRSDVKRAIVTLAKGQQIDPAAAAA